MKLFWRLCICGLIGSLLLRALPNHLKGYYFQHWANDWKDDFVEQTRQIGLAPSGFVYAHVTMIYNSSEHDKTGRALNPTREEWYKTGASSRTPWPVDSSRITYDEWGPSNRHLSNTVRVTQNGKVFCVPYSVTAIASALPLLLYGVYRWRQRNRNAPVKQSASELVRSSAPGG